MTREFILSHLAYMATLEPAYAAKALKFYDRLLPWLNLDPTRARILDHNPC